MGGALRRPCTGGWGGSWPALGFVELSSQRLRSCWVRCKTGGAIGEFGEGPGAEVGDGGHSLRGRGRLDDHGELRRARGVYERRLAGRVPVWGAALEAAGDRRRLGGCRLKVSIRLVRSSRGGRGGIRPRLDPARIAGRAADQPVPDCIVNE